MQNEFRSIEFKCTLAYGFIKNKASVYYNGFSLKLFTMASHSRYQQGQHHTYFGIGAIFFIIIFFCTYSFSYGQTTSTLIFIACLF